MIPSNIDSLAIVPSNSSNGVSPPCAPKLHTVAAPEKPTGYNRMPTSRGFATANLGTTISTSLRPVKNLNFTSLRPVTEPWMRPLDLLVRDVRSRSELVNRRIAPDQAPGTPRREYQEGFGEGCARPPRSEPLRLPQQGETLYAGQLAFSQRR